MEVATMSSDDRRIGDVEFDGETGTYRTRYGPEVRTAGLAVVEAVAAVEGTDPVALEPIGKTVDVDALDALVTSLGDDGAGRISLSYHGYRVFVGAGRHIELEPIDSGPR